MAAQQSDGAHGSPTGRRYARESGYLRAMRPVTASGNFSGFESAESTGSLSS
jgi:hypothetical protein